MTVAEIDEVVDGLEEEDLAPNSLGLDFGIAGLVATLTAAGYQTLFSCRGHGPDDPLDHPQVRLHCDPVRARRLQSAAELAACGLERDGQGGAWLYAERLGSMFRFAEIIHSRRDELCLLPPPLAARR
jgi:hypothetical protein